MVAGLLALLVGVALRLYFLTEKGTAMRAVGAYPEMAEARGIHSGR